jgi:predicted DNA-binding transcriptional regulator AlpA
MPEDCTVSNTPTDNITLIRDKALAAKLGVSLVTLWRMRDDLPPKIHISRGVSGRRLTDVEAWLNEKRSSR